MHVKAWSVYGLCVLYLNRSRERERVRETNSLINATASGLLCCYVDVIFACVVTSSQKGCWMASWNTCCCHHSGQISISDIWITFWQASNGNRPSIVDAFPINRRGVKLPNFYLYIQTPPVIPKLMWYLKCLFGGSSYLSSLPKIWKMTSHERLMLCSSSWNKEKHVSWWKFSAQIHFYRIIQQGITCHGNPT